MISRETIDKIFDAARIEEVVEDFVRLKKAGSNYKGLSPFTNEKTPSFMVSPVKQIFKDFSSGKGGNVVNFLMEHEQFSYPEALRYLAKKYNIEVVETGQSDEEKEKRSELESLFLLNDYANRLFQKQLWESEEGKSIGLSYFRERGFKDETIRQFQLGYSLEGYQKFTDQALRDGYQLAFLDKIGLTKVDGERKTDRFRGRVMFPILSHTGRVLGFGGRTLKREAKMAKYLNSPESDIYHKSKILYGIYQAKQGIARTGRCYLVEGYTDVISLHQAGVTNVVASSGTALTVDQIALIKRFTQNITLLFDGDPAGIRASLRGIDLLLEQDMKVQVVLFPDGEDPDSFARSVSQAELMSYLEEEGKDFLQFKAGLLLKEAGDSPLARTEAAREMVKSIALIPDLLTRNAYLQETARLLQYDEKVLFSELGQRLSQQAAREEKEAQRRAERAQAGQEKMAVVEPDAPEKAWLTQPGAQTEKDLCWLLLNYGDESITLSDEEEEKPVTEKVVTYVLSELENDQLEFEHPLFREILALFQAKWAQEEKIAKVEDFLREGNKELMHQVVDLVAEDHRLHRWDMKRVTLPDSKAFVARFTQEAVLRFKEKRVQSLLKQLQEDIRASTEPETEKLHTFQRLNALRSQINQRLNRIV